MLAAAAEEHKVRHGSGALAALASSCPRDSPVLANAADTPNSSLATSSILASPDTNPAVGPASAPVAISTGRKSSLGVAHPSSASSGGRFSALLHLTCFSSGGGHGVLGDEEDVGVAAGPECEVGIRPSFYWMEGAATEQQRLEAEASLRFLKADCQDEARFIQDFAGIRGLTFIGVFDGHGPNGRAAAKFASERLPEILALQTAAMRSRSERRRLKAMKEACHEVDLAMRDYKKAGFDASMSGTTACFGILSGNRLLLANVGDSRCVLARARSDGGVDAEPLTTDAKPELPVEERRIALSGGVVRQLLDEKGERCGAYRVFRRGDDVLPGLAMSRSLGDMYAHSVGVTWEPMLSAHSLGTRALFLIFATDGLWDVMDNDRAADFVERYRQCRDEAGLSCAEALTLEAHERWKEAHDEALVDDVSVAILHVTPLPPIKRELGRRGSWSSTRGLPRAASCNDEANELWSAWRHGGEKNPSHHSPRHYFQHLYADGEIDIDDGRNVSLPLPEESKHCTTAAAAAETAAVPDIAASSALAVAGDYQHDDPSLSEDGLMRSSAFSNASPLLDTSDSSHNEQRQQQQQQHQKYHHTLVSHPRAISPGMPIPGRSHSGSRPIPSGSSRNGGGGAGDLLSCDRALSREPSGSCAVGPIPFHTKLPPASAPACMLLSEASNEIAADEVFPPIRKVQLANAGSLGGSSGEPWQGQSPHPSASMLPAVPSWDGAFVQSFASEGSLKALAVGIGDDTPRSPAQSESGASGSHPPSSPWHAKARPKRCEGRHEGKVHRGVPQSMSISMSSTGLASHGRHSTDSEAWSRGCSRVGSLEDPVALNAALNGTMDRGSSGTLCSPSSGRGGGYVLSRSVSDAQGRNAAFTASFSSKLRRPASYSALSTLSERPEPGRMLIVRNVHWSANAQQAVSAAAVGQHS